MHTEAGLIALILIIIGTLGSVLPFLPGLPVAWLGLLIYAWATDFTTVTIWGLIVFAILTALTVMVDVLAPAIATRGRKASKMGTVGAVIGGLLGIFVLGPIGILLGPFIGAFIGEMMNNTKTQHAFRVAIASMFGLVISSVFKLIIGTSMFIYFLIAAIN